MRNAAAKAVWPLCETPRATSMAPVGVSRTKIPPYPPATASRGVPAPMSWRISNDRLWPATWSRYRLCTFSRPRSQVRRMPPRSRLWAKQRSTISARSLNPDFSPKNSVESDYLLQTNSYRNFREATKIQGVFPFRAVFRPAAGGFARFRRAIARRPVSPSSFPCFATHR